ncbi:hypothetical protein HYH03_010963 [Edaphochlamys debaryana]|uniref:PSI-K n=1 Tax=Edaphochlamys debaryana TaxID=47281 RepID=A0A836BWX0_9CHLO|nr:hypothetical protein HYH03_010963 [Edaphochlamys debaryana]|eukprot:KAG2490569.1 hypothetical protein HYH03_010963 [Edaphochlamys debaryana]
MALVMKSSAPAIRPAKASRRNVVVRADGAFLGSSTNVIMIASTGACLAAARFGFAPTSRRNTNQVLKLEESKNPSTVLTNDPAGFTIVDVLAMGAAGHGIGIGIVLGLKGIGAL